MSNIVDSSNRLLTAIFPKAKVSLDYPGRYLEFIDKDKLDFFSSMELKSLLTIILMTEWENHLEIDIAMDLEELLWIDDHIPLERVEEGEYVLTW